MRLPVEAPEATAWRPQLTFLNLSRAVGVSDTLAAPLFRAVGEASGTRCFLSQTVHGEFMHCFKLRAFPFDTQTFMVRAVLWRSPLERVLPRAAVGAPAATNDDDWDGDDGGDAADVDADDSGLDIDEAEVQTRSLPSTPYNTPSDSPSLTFAAGVHAVPWPAFVPHGAPHPVPRWLCVEGRLGCAAPWRRHGARGAHGRAPPRRGGRSAL